LLARISYASCSLFLWKEIDMKITEITFEAEGHDWKLKTMTYPGRRSQLPHEKGGIPQIALQTIGQPRSRTWIVDETGDDSPGRIAMNIFELIHGYLGTSGDCAEIITLIEMLQD